MKAKQILLYLIIMVLVSCKPEEKPPVVSYVFSDVSVDVGQTSATITCRNESIDDDKVHASVLLSRNENITDATKYPLRLQNDTLRCTISGLEQNTMYFFCFEVYTAYEHKRTEEVNHFQTTSSGGNITVTTSEAINITQTSATGGGSVIADGNNVVSMRGVCWDTLPNPNALQSSHLVSGQGTGTFLVNVTGLKSHTQYYMKAYAVCNDVVYYGNEVNFTTQSAQLPTVTTGEVANITRTSALASGNVTNDGGADVTSRGLCWSTEHSPTVEGTYAESGTGTGAYTIEITDLTPNTTYFVRAFAENAQGISYGEEVEFTTADDISSPAVVTGSVDGTTAHGEVTSDGGAEVTERGICWGTEHAPTTEGTHATSGAGVGSFSVELTNLTPGTTYYVRAYARNNVGTAYGNEVTFSTTANKPTVTTEEVSNITQTTAQGGGNVTDDGGVEVTERGICWSTSHNPTTSGSHATSGTGMGGYTVHITGLTANTTYYVRAYAINSQGTSYGDEVSFKTSQNHSAPTVTTSQVTNVTQTTATGGGNVTSDGGATVTERGICWSTSHNPTTSGSHANSGTGTGSYTVNMTGLTANTTYYVRAYAKNSEGTSYGNEVSFQTSATMPTVTTNQISNITSTTATGGGNVTNGGGANVTARGVCWSTSHNPTVSGNHTTNGTGTGSFTSSLTGLSPNTTYYVRAYATNSAGTAYGAEVSFTTSQNVTLPTVTTSQVTNITQTSATGGGNVTNSGNATVTARGVCWSTSHNPTVSGSHTTNGTGTGSFTSSLTGLTANTTYYVRAYATNSAGTAYGSEVSFTTSQVPSYTIAVSSSPTNGGTVTGGGTYQQGQSCTVHATANSGYTFTNWTENGNVVSTNANYTFAVNSNRTLVANFSTQSYTINVSASPSNGGSVSGGGNYNYGQSCTVHATANSGYTFTNWTENGNVVSTNANYTFTVNANRTLVANFSTQSYTISVSASPSNGGSVSGGGNYNYGQSCTVHATANSGYTFTNWTENGNVVSTNANYTFTVNANRTLVANFSTQSYTISVSASPNNGGSVTGGGNYNYGQSCTVHATANSGYTFTNWTENGNQVSTNENYTFTVTSSRALVAHFTAQPQAPTGAINGLFSVSATQQVYFSQGNLQYKASTNTWRFAANQWDCVGGTIYGTEWGTVYESGIKCSNNDISSTYSGWIDLFGWGTSGWNNGNTCYHPWDSSIDPSLYGPPGPNHLTGAFANADWGVYNSITNGGNTADTWRTLTRNEWNYVLNNRNTSSGVRYAKAQVNSIKGVIILPDNWNVNTYILYNTNNSTATFSSNTINASQWSVLQNAGAVFLPAASHRIGNGENVVGYPEDGWYWSTWCDTNYSNHAFWMNFSDTGLSAMGVGGWGRATGCSVRLVHDAQ